MEYRSSEEMKLSLRWEGSEKDGWSLASLPVTQPSGQYDTASLSQAGCAHRGQSAVLLAEHYSVECFAPSLCILDKVGRTVWDPY